MALDIAKLTKEAQARYDKMKGNPDHRGDPDFTYSAYVLKKVAELETGVRAEADQRLGNVLADSSEAYRRKTLAHGVANGKYDA